MQFEPKNVDEEGNEMEPQIVDPSKWMPISDELQQRADHPRFARCREAIRRAKSKREFQVDPLQKLLLGPHASLPRLAKLQEACKDEDDPSSSSGASMKKPKPRSHCIFTAAAGFVRYAG
jgi:hypothetical protein